ncbi:M15 family metallopeptidase [Ilumatobacter sp.]|uniref:M15 family metallopeptidase n=1 Tax=Ilumatobacter sp. TaxID=1967498 RepID=UPI003B52CF62
MSAIPVGEIVARIGSIENRFVAATDPAAPRVGPLPVVDPGPEFQAFGDVYRSALTARDATVGTAFAVPAGGPGPHGASMLGSPMTGFGPDVAAGGGRAAAAIGGVLAPPGERPVGGYGSMPIPDQLRSFGNGEIPPGGLTQLTTQSNHRLYAPAAASWNNVVEAAAAEGIELRITDSYRDYDEQVDLVRRKGLYSQGGLAATPGTSNHGWGLAVDADVRDPRTLQWLKVNGPRFGWVESVPREPWHWEFRPDQV